MAKKFNVNGACEPGKHYMVALETRLQEIRAMIDEGEYFVINKARQYGKTTTLRALADSLKEDYLVAGMDFQRIGASKFVSENVFSVTFAQDFLKKLETGNEIDSEILSPLKMALNDNPEKIELYELFNFLTDICSKASKPLVLIIDEVDSATNNEVFLDFLAQLRAAYLDRNVTPTFTSVILAGVYDIRNIRQKIRPDAEHKMNSPWNIAAKFRVDMSFSAEEIAGMLKTYEADYQTGMDIREMAQLIYDHTSGYPYLVSSLCKNIDEEIAGTGGFPDQSSAWTRVGFMEAEKLLVNDNNTLFQSLIGKLADYPELKAVIYELLFTGRTIPYVAQNHYIDVATMLGFIKNEKGTAVISNRIFETVLYNLFISEEFAESRMYHMGMQEKNQFIVGGHLDVKRVLEKFVETFDYLYGDADETFLEDAGRRYFMLFLKPIINGIGNSYVEPETRNHERMDIVIDYRGEQSIIEMKIWRGNAYKERGEAQLSEYLECFHLKKGYMLSFNFNKKKEIGVKEIILGDKVLIEAVV